MTAKLLKVEIDPTELRDDVIETAAQQISARLLELPDVQKRVEEITKDSVRARCDEAVKPIIDAGIKAFVFQRTNEFGEKKGAPVSFTEYLVKTAEQYLEQRVDYAGVPKKPDSYGYKDNQTRLAHMINTHLQFHISHAMKDAVQVVMKTIAPALAKTCEIQIQQVVASLTAKPR